MLSSVIFPSNFVPLFFGNLEKNFTKVKIGYTTYSHIFVELPHEGDEAKNTTTLANGQ